MPEISEKIADRVRASFARQTLMQTFGAELTAVGAGHVEITAPILPLALQQHGFAHAGLTFALGDSAAGYAALTLMPLDSEVLTVEMKINLIAPAAGARLIARGRVVKPGRRLMVVGAEVSADSNGEWKPVAILQGTMIPAQPGA